MITIPELQEDAALEAFMVSFEAVLGKSDLALSGKNALYAEIIGATAGYACTVNDFGFEIYLFDPASGDEKTDKNLKTARESGYITIFGTEINGKELTSKCTVSENMALIFPGEEYGLLHPDKESIVKAFMDTAV